MPEGREATLTRFVQTPEYRRLVAVVAPMADDDVEPWLAEWLIEPVFTLRELPIETVARPGGPELVETQLIRIAAFVVA